MNVGFLQIIAPDYVKLRVYERGVGETLACGTGACAAVVVGQQWGHLSENVTVELPGGLLTIQWSSPMPLYMTGPAIRVFEGVIAL